MPQIKQKLYCYVDETGQDASSEFFIVVAVITEGDQQHLNQDLLLAEHTTKIGEKKWHKARASVRTDFIRYILKNNATKGKVYYGRYTKPLPFFFPMLETIAKAIQASVADDLYEAIIYVDGIDKQKARELTNALRIKGIKAPYVRSARDESEPLIRLADRWAGCIRDGFEQESLDTELVAKATRSDYLKSV